MAVTSISIIHTRTVTHRRDASLDEVLDVLPRLLHEHTREELEAMDPLDLEDAVRSAFDGWDGSGPDPREWALRNADVGDASTEVLVHKSTCARCGAHLRPTDLGVSSRRWVSDDERTLCDYVTSAPHEPAGRAQEIGSPDRTGTPARTVATITLVTSDTRAKAPHPTSARQRQAVRPPSRRA